MTGTYAAVRWTTSEYGEHPQPEILITKADSTPEAQDAFQEYNQKHGLRPDAVRATAPATPATTNRHQP